MNSSKILEIRKVTEISRIDDRVDSGHGVHEELRRKHIATLEQLQILTDDNASLQQYLDSLKKRFCLSDSTDAVTYDLMLDCGESNNTNEDDSILLTKIMTQDKEIKSLKANLSQAEGEVKDTKEQSNLLRQQEFESRRKLERERMESEETYSNLFSAKVLSLQKELLEFEILSKNETEALKIKHGEELRKCQSALEALSVVKEEIMNVKKLNAETEANLVDLKKSISEFERDGQLKEEDLHVKQLLLDRLSTDFKLLQDERDAINLHLVSRNEDNEEHASEVAILKAEIDRLKSINLTTLVNNDIFLRELSDSFLSSTEVTNSLPPVSAIVDAGTVPNIIGVDEYSDRGNSFDEYVRLRKENKALHLQIAFLQQPRPNSKRIL